MANIDSSARAQKCDIFMEQNRANKIQSTATTVTTEYEMIFGQF